MDISLRWIIIALLIIWLITYNINFENFASLISKAKKKNKKNIVNKFQFGSINNKCSSDRSIYSSPRNNRCSSDFIFGSAVVGGVRCKMERTYINHK